jgi:hypothetical protein
VAQKPRPVAPLEQRVAQPGDRICGKCGEANDPARKFCRRCGNSLVEARIVAEPTLPWWKRLFRRGPKQPKQYAAGERKSSMQKAAPKSGGLGGIVKSIGLVRGLLGLVVAIGIFGYIGIPSFQGLVMKVADPIMHGGPTQIIDNIRKIVAPKAVAVHPIKDTVTGSSEVTDHGAPLALDTFSNTDWEATDKAPELTIPFQEAIDLHSVIVYSGSAAKFVDLRRPSALEFVLPDGSTQRVELLDTKDKQTISLSGNDVKQVVVRIVATYGPEDAPIALSELEFFKRD